MSKLKPQIGVSIEKKERNNTYYGKHMGTGSKRGGVDINKYKGMIQQLRSSYEIRWLIIHIFNTVDNNFNVYIRNNSKLLMTEQEDLCYLEPIDPLNISFSEDKCVKTPETLDKNSSPSKQHSLNHESNIIRHPN